MNSPPSSSHGSNTPIDDGEQDDYAIKPEDVPTIHDLYKDGSLDSEDPPAVVHPVNAALLDKISIVKGDITEFAVDVIVNAANSSLLGGGGVDGAIHSAAGPGLKKECRTLNGAETGETKMTDAYDLPCKRIAHTVGPIFSFDNRDKSERLLRSCYQGCLELTVQEGLKTIAFCSISTGVYGYPIGPATRVALDTVREFLATDRGSTLERVIFIVFSQKDLSVYYNLLPLYFPSHFGIISRDSFTTANTSSSPNPAEEKDVASALDDALKKDQKKEEDGGAVPDSDTSMASASASFEERTVEGREVVEEEKVEGTTTTTSGGAKREREEEESEGAGKEKLRMDKVGGVVEEEKGPEEVKEL
ncbi:hypothetical protein BDY24DRAFT_354581 [Mrakia frigida]|uniref:macro domain-containing protein n=1 Tax=Mrakia frigida TaxID=29902 RepID=UPI003FCBFB14